MTHEQHEKSEAFWHKVVLGCAVLNVGVFIIVVVVLCCGCASAPQPLDVKALQQVPMVNHPGWVT